MIFQNHIHEQYCLLQQFRIGRNLYFQYYNNLIHHRDLCKNESLYDIFREEHYFLIYMFVRHCIFYFDIFDYSYCFVSNDFIHL
jgi:hypothetical protein